MKEENINRLMNGYDERWFSVKNSFIKGTPKNKPFCYACELEINYLNRVFEPYDSVYYFCNDCFTEIAAKYPM